jgi:hypothetical protein
VASGLIDPGDFGNQGWRLIENDLGPEAHRSDWTTLCRPAIQSAVADETAVGIASTGEQRRKPTPIQNRPILLKEEKWNPKN